MFKPYLSVTRPVPEGSWRDFEDIVLPSYPELVTTAEGITINNPGQRSPHNYVHALLQLPVTDRRYARDENGTKCNFFVHDCLHVMGYPVAFALAHDYITQWSKSGPLKPMVLQDAITNANMGCPTVAALLEPARSHSHVMMVLPQAPALEPGRLMVAQAGAVNFYGRYMSVGVPAARCREVLYFGAP